MAIPENLVTTIAAEPAPDAGAGLAERAAAQRQAREDAEVEAMTKARDKAVIERGFDPKAPTPMQKGALALAQQEEATRQRARTAATASARVEPTVPCRITKIGHGKVSMGVHVGGVGEAFYEWKETPDFPIGVARALEARGLVEIVE